MKVWEYSLNRNRNKIHTQFLHTFTDNLQSLTITDLDVEQDCGEFDLELEDDS